MYIVSAGLKGAFWLESYQAIGIEISMGSHHEPTTLRTPSRPPSVALGWWTSTALLLLLAILNGRQALDQNIPWLMVVLGMMRTIGMSPGSNHPKMILYNRARHDIF